MTSFSPCRGQCIVIVYLVSVPNLVQLPLPTLDGLAYPRGADGLVHQCAWCGRVLDRGGRFRIWAHLLRGDVSRDISAIRTVDRVMVEGEWIDVARYRAY